MAKYDIALPHFNGFMVDSTQANWNVVKIIYRSGDASKPMLNHEWTCFFHWT